MASPQRLIDTDIYMWERERETTRLPPCMGGAPVLHPHEKYLIHRAERKREKEKTSKEIKNSVFGRGIIYAHSASFSLSLFKKKLEIFFSLQLMWNFTDSWAPDFVFDLSSSLLLSCCCICIYIYPLTMSSFTAPGPLVNVITCDCRPLKDISLSMFCVRALLMKRGGERRRRF